MDDEEKVFRELMDKMIKDYGLSHNDIKTMAEFYTSVESGQYIPRLNKKMFNLISKKMGIKPFVEEEKPTEFDAVIPLFRYKSEKMEHFASGVLVESKSCIYLLTASHVVETTKKIYMPMKNDIIPITGGCYWIPENPEQRTRIDFAYVKLDADITSQIKEHMVTLKLSDIDCKNQCNPNDFLVFTGYPHRKSKNHEDVISTEFFEYVGSYTDEAAVYSKYNCNIRDNTIIRFNFRDTTTRRGDNIKAVVSPEGISGGGIFTSKIKTKLDSDDTQYRPQLIGIGHYYDRQNKVLLGTKIEYCLSYMASNERDIYEELVEGNIQ